MLAHTPQPVHLNNGQSVEKFQTEVVPDHTYKLDLGALAELCNEAGLNKLSQLTIRGTTLVVDNHQQFFQLAVNLVKLLPDTYPNKLGIIHYFKNCEMLGYGVD